MFGIGGEIDLESTFVEELKIGQIARKGRRTLVSSENDLGDSVAVFLGEDFLRQVDVEFDLSHGVVRLFEPRDCSVASLAYWADHASAIEIDAVDDARPQIRFTVRINGKPLRALLDSGATVSVLDRPDASLLGVTPETPGVLALGRSAGLGRKAVDYWIGPFQSFAIGDETIRNIAIVFGDVSRNLTYTAGGYAPRRVGGTAAMLLGADFLRSHRVLVANSQRKLYFTYSGGPVFGGAAPSRSESVELEVDANPTAPQK